MGTDLLLNSPTIDRLVRNKPHVRSLRVDAKLELAPDHAIDKGLPGRNDLPTGKGASWKKGKPARVVLSGNFIRKCERRQNYFAALPSPFKRTGFNLCFHRKPFSGCLRQLALSILGHTPTHNRNNDGDRNREYDTEQGVIHDPNYGISRFSGGLPGVPRLRSQQVWPRRLTAFHAE
jgi:hypothetical protein